MKLERTFNRLCGSRLGWLMIPVVGAGLLGFAILVGETVRFFFST